MEFSGKFNTLDLQRLVELFGERAGILEELAIESVGHHGRNATVINVVKIKIDSEQVTLIIDDRSQIHLNMRLRIVIVP